MARLGFVGLLLVTLGCAAGSDNELVLGPCSIDEPLCQRFQGHSWSEEKEDLTIDAAKEYCSSIGARLPTISELRTLVVDCETTKAGGTCGLTDTCSSSVTCYDDHACANCGDGGQSVFGGDNHFWSSTPFGNETTFKLRPVKPGSMWTIAFRYNSIDPWDPDYRSR